jgi:hypothetical protein
MSKNKAEDHRRAYMRQSASRRLFIKTLGLGAAGLAAGGAAAWTKSELDVAATAGTSLSSMQQQLSQTSTEYSTLQSMYASLQAQSSGLQTQLSAASAHNSQLSSSLVVSQNETAELRTQLTNMQAALDQVNARLARTTELVSLYDRLESVGLDGVVQSGLSAMAGALTGMAGPSLTLRGGIDSARGLLTMFENALPDLQSAMTWLGDHVVRLKVGLWSVERSAQQTVNSAVAGIAAVFGGFTGFVIDNLPFNIGKKVRETLSATLGVLSTLTQLTDAAADQVLLKVSKHVDDGPQSWKKTLIAPLRDTTLAAADAVLNAASTTGSTYQSSLESPAAAVLEKRRLVRDEIARHRAAHGI